MSKKKNNKYSFFEPSVNDLFAQAKQHFVNKAYNLWMDKFEWNGLDKEVEEQQRNYIMRKFYADGTVACREISGVKMLAFMPYAPFEYDMYDYPSKVSLVNLRNVSQTIIPLTPQIVNKEVVIGFCQPNHKSIASIVNDYAERLAQIEMVINTNLQLQKMPFLVGVSPEDKDKMEEIVKKLLRNEVVIFADLEDLQKIQTLATQTPYVIDKLEAHSNNLWNELLTQIGIDNIGHEKGERLIVDEANANNDLINAYGSAVETEIKYWLSNIERVFGRKITIKAKAKPVSAVAEGVDKKSGLQSGEAKSQEGTGDQE